MINEQADAHESQMCSHFLKLVIAEFDHEIDQYTKLKRKALAALERINR